jgi:hypothetical protein
MSETYPALLPGDIGAVKGRGIFAWLSNKLLVPHTDRFHFFVIWDYLTWDKDYVILESIGKGIAVGRLSFYNPDNIEIYRPVLTGEEDPVGLLGCKACAELTKKGRARYDYILYAQLLLGALRLMLSGKFPPYDPAQLPYGRNQDYVCTEAANYGWREVGHPIIEPGTVPVPAGYEKARILGEITQIYP